MTRSKRARPALLVALLCTALAVLCVLSLAVGAAAIAPDQVVRALFGHATSRLVENIVWSARVPRTTLGLAAGAALGISGALMQALTRNPLADPGILGVSAGASFAIVLAVGVLGIGSFHGYVRLLAPREGSVRLDGRELHSLPSRELAQRLGILPQSPVAPEGLTVIDLVNRGRSPHQTWWRQWSKSDEHAVKEALAATGMTDLADRPVDELSGGQRQRAWIAMAVAQGTPVLLLDEPTTYLDLAHQIDVLDLITDLNRREHRTVVMVLHDLNQACRYADHVVAMKSGRIAAEGTPAEVITADLVRDVFALRCRITPDPVSGTPLVIPMGRHHAEPT